MVGSPWIGKRIIPHMSTAREGVLEYTTVRIIWKCDHIYDQYFISKLSSCKLYFVNHNSNKLRITTKTKQNRITSIPRKYRYDSVAKVERKNLMLESSFKTTKLQSRRATSCMFVPINDK